MKKTIFGLPNKQKYLDFVNQYLEIKESLQKYCDQHLSGSWLLNVCLWGESIENSQPVILLLFEDKMDSWKTPIWEGSDLILIEMRNNFR